MLNLSVLTETASASYCTIPLPPEVSVSLIKSPTAILDNVFGVVPVWCLRAFIISV